MGRLGRADQFLTLAKGRVRRRGLFQSPPLPAGSVNGRRIGLRADMDALPIEEETNLPYRSTRPGTMHACGHDGHTTMLLGAARYLAETRAFDGTAVLIFQPAEEGLGGSRAMLKDGLFERFPCDEVYGLHNMPGDQHGQVWLRPGPFMAAADFFDITVRGRGSHAACARPFPPPPCW